MDESLIDPKQSQGELWPSAEVITDAQADAEGRNPAFTAELFFQKHPEVYKAISLMRCVHAIPGAVIAKAYGVSRNTVAAIARREMQGKTVEQLRETAAAEYRHLAALSRERAVELLLDPESKPRLAELATAAGIAEDKAELLSGGVTQRVAVLQVSATRQDYEEWLRAQRMGATGEISGQKGEVPGPVILEAEAAVLGGAADSESDVALRKSLHGNATTGYDVPFDVLPSADSGAPARTGGEGVEAAGGGD